MILMATSIGNEGNPPVSDLVIQLGEIAVIL
jgi:hypothetical protein